MKVVYNVFDSLGVLKQGPVIAAVCETHIGPKLTVHAGAFWGRLTTKHEARLPRSTCYVLNCAGGRVTVLPVLKRGQLTDWKLQCCADVYPAESTMCIRICDTHFSATVRSKRSEPLAAFRDPAASSPPPPSSPGGASSSTGKRRAESEIERPSDEEDARGVCPSAFDYPTLSEEEAADRSVRRL